MKLRNVRPGDMIRVRWIDSGADDTGAPGDGGLVIKTSYGRVTEIGRDEKLHTKACSRKRCRCARIEFVMCSHGEGASESGSIGTVWSKSVVSIDRLKAV